MAHFSLATTTQIDDDDDDDATGQLKYLTVEGGGFLAPGIIGFRIQGVLRSCCE